MLGTYQGEGAKMAAITRRQLVAATGLSMGGWMLNPIRVSAAAEDKGVTRLASAIHQEPLIDAPPQRVYRALMNSSQFDRIAGLSEAMQSAQMQKLLPRHPSHIGQQEGEAFSLFGGYITGRQLRLVPNALIVQAWRAESWDPEDYSIARFELKASESGTRILFDHTGFPSAEAEHLAAGWYSNYWHPISKLLS
jgi:activator of HSP90 ATPase